jgi:hypothetical protein
MVQVVYEIVEILPRGVVRGRPIQLSRSSTSETFHR